MAAARRPTPLFDLISRGETARPASNKPIIRVELKPSDAPGPSVLPRHDPAPLASPAARPSVPVNFWYLAGAAVVLVAVLAWAGGVLFGRGQERDRLSKELGPAFADRPRVQEPGTAQPQGVVPVEPSPTPGPGVTAPKTPPQVPMSTGNVLTPRGMEADPRQRGLNYLNLASLPRPDAESAVAFLAANGVEVVGLPVDTPAWAAKNQGSQVQWYALVVNQGLTREQLSLPVKANLESQVAKLGQIWQKQHRGASNFARPAWEKCQ